MNQCRQYRQMMAALTAAALMGTVYTATRHNATVALIIVVILGLGASVLNARYKIATWEEIRRISPGSYERLLREETAPMDNAPPYPPDVEALLKSWRRFQKLATWMPMLDIVVYFIGELLLRQL